MNEELRTRLIRYLDVLEDAGKKGAEFVSDQAPETVKQFVQWEIVYNSMFAAAFLALCVAICVIYRFVYVRAVKMTDEADRGICLAFGGIIWIAVLIGSGHEMIHHAACATKAYVAPNVFLIEKAADLLKNSK